MSVTAVGPALDLDGPLPVAPPHSLLNTPGVRVQRDVHALGGAVVYGYPTGCAELWDPCSEGTFRTKAEDSEQPLPRFDAFVVYKALQCSTMGIGDPVEFRTRIERVLDATMSAAVETALAAGFDPSVNPYFGDVNVVDVTPTPGTAVTPGVGLSLLEQAIGETCRQGMIHATPAVVSALTTDRLQGEEMNLVTPNGTPVVSGMGYQGVDTPFLETPDTTEDYMFATGPVSVFLDPVDVLELRDVVDQATNTVVFRAERYVLATWDTALQAAVLVDWAA